MTAFVAFVVPVALLVPAALVAIPVHELGHAVTAYLLGDRSVRYFGYLTFNPRRFIDPVGALAVFIALVGWGRRVPVQGNRINTTARRLAYDLGGPAANLVVGVLLGLLLRVLLSARLLPDTHSAGDLVAYLIYAVWFLNLSMFAFQLLPIPGLDGWNVVETLLRDRKPRFFFNVDSRRREIWIGAVLIVILFQIFQGASLLGLVMSPFFTPASLISMGTCGGYGIPGLSGLFPCLPWGR